MSARPSDQSASTDSDNRVRGWSRLCASLTGPHPPLVPYPRLGSRKTHAIMRPALVPLLAPTFFGAALLATGEYPGALLALLVLLMELAVLWLVAHRHVRRVRTFLASADYCACTRCGQRLPQDAQQVTCPECGTPMPLPTARAVCTYTCARDLYWRTFGRPGRRGPWPARLFGPFVPYYVSLFEPVRKRCSSDMASVPGILPQYLDPALLRVPLQDGPARQALGTAPFRNTRVFSENLPPALMMILVFWPAGRFGELFLWLVPLCVTLGVTVWLVDRQRWVANHRRLRAADYRLCPYCGYSLVNRPEHTFCPECGCEVRLRETRSMWRRMFDPDWDRIA